MPYKKVKRSNGSKVTWLVVNSTTGRILGHHTSETDANAQLAALYANVPDASTMTREQIDKALAKAGAEEFFKVVQTYELDAEVFAVGKWNGMTFTQSDLEGIADTFNKLAEIHHVPLKFGHNSEQPMTDGQPALGWVDRVWVAGKKLMAHFTDMPEAVFQAIQAKRYKHVSIELDFDVQHMGRQYPMVLSGVALLGADLPAVNVLQDLHAYMRSDREATLVASRRAEFTASQDNASKKEKRMELSEQELNAKLAEREQALRAEFATKSKELEDRATKAEGETADMKKAQEQADFDRRSAAYKADLEALVKDGRMLPAQREALEKQFSRETAGVLEAQIATFKLGPKIDPKGGSNIRSGNGDAETNPDAGYDGELVELTRQHMDSHPNVSFSAARAAVMRRNPELARQYVMGNAEG